MKTRSLLIASVLLITGVVATSDASDNNPRRRFAARMSSFNEVPSIATGAHGTFRATLNNAETVLSFEMTWSGLSGPPMVAHVHLGQFFANGSVSFFLCGGGGQPACPATTSGTIRGTVTAANVMAVAAQGLRANDLGQIVGAMRMGVTYANMHTMQFPGGENRGEIFTSEGEDDNGENSDNN